MILRNLFNVLAACVLLAGTVHAQSTQGWPQWNGPNRDGKSSEVGLLQTWPASGPRLLWTARGLGTGYSSISIADGRIYTMGDLKDASGNGHQYIIAFGLANHQKLWTALVGPPHSDGSRCTPTYSDGLLYAIGTDGDIVCVQASTGKEVWRKNLTRDFGGFMMSGWKWSESPLIDGNKVICTPGSNDALLVALNKKSGDLIWKCQASGLGPKGKDGAGYSSAVLATIDGIRQYVQFVGRGIVGVSAADGKLLWSYNHCANDVANITTPLVHGNEVFGSSAYGAGSGLVKIMPDNGGLKAVEVYYLGPDVFQNHHGGVVLVDGYIYGGNGQNAGAPTCINWATGKIMWKVPNIATGSASVIYADNNLYYFYDSGNMALVAATPTGFKLHGKFDTPPMAGTAWAHPVILNGKLYLRHDDALFCYDIKG
jgi:outer membrane protein assembly factor BamB